MKVVIVAKTRKGKGACVGAVNFEGRSLRLIAADASVDEFAGMAYEVGDVWDIEATPATDVIPPHSENIIVSDKRRLPPIDDLIVFIERNMPPHTGGLEALYEGLTQHTEAGALYIANRTGLPPFSTTFWRPDRPLTREDSGEHIRYRYSTDDGGRTLTFVGFQEPVDVIEAGTLLRVSLAHWRRPEEKPDGEMRCYVQLSGWFLGTGEEVARGSGDGEIGRESTSPIAGGTRHWAMGSSPRTADLAAARAALQDTFGFEDFWPMQEKVIASILGGQDTLAIMPTGSGKSLCYQLPAVLFDGLTVVVSPLISLMQDQVDQLREMSVPAVFLNSSLSYDQYLHTTAKVRNGEVKLLYVAPETLLRPETLLLLDKCQVTCLAVDEAHCISDWGHDFRPEYRKLIDVRRRLPQAVCFALTATATDRVRGDIGRQLDIPVENAFVASFDRPNLFLEVQPKTNAWGRLLDFLDDHRDQPGIIYCATRRQTDSLAADLRVKGYSVLPYHAGLDDLVRRRYQRKFSRDDVQIVVATVAFGMGIDKSNVRFVVHYDLPKDIESYYQQIGRSGRDGLRADCLLLFNRADVFTIQHFIEEKAPSEQHGARVRLKALVDYAESGACRRLSLLRYFDDPYSKGSCGMCDNCLKKEDEEAVDLTIPAQMFLSCVKRTGELYGSSHIIKVLRGSSEQRVLAKRHDRLSTYGIGRDYSHKAWSDMARQFVEQGLLKRDMEYGSLKLTPRAYAVFNGKQVLGRPVAKGPTKVRERAEAQEYDGDLFELLRTRRKELADAAGVPPYIVFSDRSLVDMATHYPRSSETFSHIYGVGRAKLEKYAGEFLPLIRAYCQEKGIEQKPKPDRRRKRSSKRGRRQVVVEAYQSGWPIEELAAELEIKPKTVIRHLARYLQAGNSLRQEGFLECSQLPEAMQEKVLAAFEEHGAEFLRPVFEALGEMVSYEELRILQLFYLARENTANQRTSNP